MIAPAKHADNGAADKGLPHDVATKLAESGQHASKAALVAARQWIANHPVAAVGLGAAAGLIAGWAAKR